MAAAAALLRAASGDESELRGTVRLTASEFIGGAVLPPMLARFHAGHPTVDIELSLSDRTEDLLRRDADLAVRNVMPTQSALVTRRIGGGTDLPIRPPRLRRGARSACYGRGTGAPHADRPRRTHSSGPAHSRA
jgi:DNA-binding transcriptional LysR family regulator